MCAPVRPHPKSLCRQFPGAPLPERAEEDENSRIAVGRVETTALATARLAFWLYLLGALCEPPAWAADASVRAAIAVVIAARELRILPSIRSFEAGTSFPVRASRPVYGKYIRLLLDAQELIDRA
jgi:hypothetical protein